MVPCKKMCFKFQKATFWRKLENCPFSNHCLGRLVPSILMKLGTFIWWSFLVLTNKSARIYMNIMGDSVNQSLKSRKTRKSGLVPMWRQEKVGDLFLMFPAILKHDKKPLIHIPSLKCSRNEAFGHFLVNFFKRLPCNDDC